MVMAVPFAWRRIASVSLEIIPQQRRVEHEDDEHPIAEPRRPGRVTTAASTTEWPGGLFIGVWGESAGGHLAALIALTAHRPELEGTLGVLDESSAVDAVVDWYGVADLTSTPQPDSAAQPPPELLTAPQDILVGGQDQHA
jgi:BD-FAE